MTAMFCLVALFSADPQAKTEKFRDTKIEAPFEQYLLAQPLLMEVTGAKIIKKKDGGTVVLAVASTVLKDNSPQERLRAERVCKVKALASVVAEKQGIQVAHTEKLEERTVVVIEDGQEKATSVSDLLQVTKTKVQGIARDMPVVGTWKSRDGDTFYLALGIVCDQRGVPVRQEAR